MTSKPGTDGPRPARARRRPRTVAVLLAVCFAVWLSAVPGFASAAPGVTPFVDCYRANSDGTLTVVLGYTNTNTRTTTIPYGSNNMLYPSRFQKTQPTQFLTGTRRGVFSVNLSQAELYGDPRWQLDGKTLSHWTAGSATECSPSTPLPSLGNGAGIAAVLVAGGAFGVIFVRRLIRRSGAV